MEEVVLIAYTSSNKLRKITEFVLSKILLTFLHVSVKCSIIIYVYCKSTLKEIAHLKKKTINIYITKFLIRC